MIRLVIVALLVTGSACSSPKASCIEGQSSACACPNGSTGAQVCNSHGAFGSCSCLGPSTTPVASGSASCSMAALNCASFSSQGRTGWALHKLVFEARSAQRYAEAICLASTSISATDTVLAGASHFESAQAWHGLGCNANAIAAITASLQVRPHHRDGWQETCDYCKALGAPCAECQESALRPCPAEAKAALLLGAALKTSKKVTVMKCVAGRFPDPGWALVAWVGDRADAPASHAGSIDDGQAAHLHHTVLRDTGTVVANVDREATWHERNDDEETKTLRLQSTDFDGDGVDEIIEETEYQRRGWSIGNLAVLVVDGNDLNGTLDIKLSYDNGGMDPERGPTSCKAAWSVSGTAKMRVLVVTSTVSSGPDASTECMNGVTKYELRGGKLVKS